MILKLNLFQQANSKIRFNHNLYFISRFVSIENFSYAIEPLVKGLSIYFWVLKSYTEKA